LAASRPCSSARDDFAKGECRWVAQLASQLVFADTRQRRVLKLENSALTHVADAQADNADATLTLTRATLDEISLQKTTFPAALQAGPITLTGQREKVGELLRPFDTFTPGFPIVEARPPH
jgi:alkyl sulfatase BDS1-like metallo-beta-lactamase superfamily hydrolase